MEAVAPNPFPAVAGIVRWTVSGQGYHLALNNKQVDQLLFYNDENALLEYVGEILEGSWAGRNTTNIEGGYKDWNVLLLCLNRGKYDPQGGTHPFNKCFFGGRLLAFEGSIVNLVMPSEVGEIVEALDKISKNDFQAVYLQPPNRHFEHMSSWSKDEEYSYALFTDLTRLRKFYRGAAQEGRAVVFYTDDPLDWFL